MISSFFLKCFISGKKYSKTIFLQNCLCENKAFLKNLKVRKPKVRKPKENLNLENARFFFETSRFLQAFIYRRFHFWWKSTFLKCLISNKKYFGETIFLRNLWFSKKWKLGILKKRSLKTRDFSLKQEKRVFAGIYHDRLCVYTSFTRNIYGVWYNLLYTSP